LVMAPILKIDEPQGLGRSTRPSLRHKVD